jgi:hypothetical protein
MASFVEPDFLKVDACSTQPQGGHGFILSPEFGWPRDLLSMTMIDGYVMNALALNDNPALIEQRYRIRRKAASCLLACSPPSHPACLIPRISQVGAVGNAHTCLPALPSFGPSTFCGAPVYPARHIEAL